MQELSIDFVIGLPLAVYHQQEVNAILMVVDRYTKFVRFVPIESTMSAADLAYIVDKTITDCFRLPKGIVFNKGSLFTSKF